ncbi:MAG: hypothetical protein K2O83_02850, partial [Schaedlerella arabinosiphila]|nr:hypothetical protein [Schaedlerella arabinosiphila]
PRQFLTFSPVWRSQSVTPPSCQVLMTRVLFSAFDNFALHYAKIVYNNSTVFLPLQDFFLKNVF